MTETHTHRASERARASETPTRRAHVVAGGCECDSSRNDVNERLPAGGLLLLLLAPCDRAQARRASCAASGFSLFRSHQLRHQMLKAFQIAGSPRACSIYNSPQCAHSICALHTRVRSHAFQRSVRPRGRACATCAIASTSQATCALPAFPPKRTMAACPNNEPRLHLEHYFPLTEYFPLSARPC